MSGRNHDSWSGEFVEEFPVDDFLEAIYSQAGRVRTAEVADKVGCDNRTAYLKLKEMEEEGLVSGRKTENTLRWG